MKHPKLRDSKKLQTFEPYPLNKFPEEVINEIGKHFIYLLCTGKTDITGSDWGDAFAQAIKGQHLDAPIGIADVTLSNMAWSMKTVKSKTPFNARTVRLISGRCSPDYSYGITDPHKDIEKTGQAVLNIWNERINIAYDHYRKVRTTVLVRSNDLLQYRLFEEECHRYPTNKYKWELNRNGNLIGRNISTNKIKFTWQPHGSQFTIHNEIPQNAIKFTIEKPPVIPKENILRNINFDYSWIHIQK